ncbi:MAG: hypothetical protein RLZ12_55 [Bacillota bacterium]
MLGVVALTPIDIHNKGFRKAFIGYDVDEVNYFLEQIMRDFELLNRERIELEKQVDDLQTELTRVLEREAGNSSQESAGYPVVNPSNTNTSLSAMEQSMHKSIRVAQEVAEEVRLNAKKEAELVLREAEKNADRIVSGALQKARSIHAGIVDMKQEAQVYQARLRAVINSHLEVVNNSDWDFLKQLDEKSASQRLALDKEIETTEQQDKELKQVVQVREQVEEVQENVADAMCEVAASESKVSENTNCGLDLKRSSRRSRRKAIF